ncbi:hypothetical protein [Jeotgalibacillus proteolyticus]|uniref:Uncharacterized protein n=1 Tax=Jeotgalibacillus proteolyticus TaxID=2082395 RepID=A0A2S5G9V8_9BACL|nr:hypothetical protein [Jeotgalibacillus proteolyticus]PPA69776.1 hypothetical protein C4B60_14665 [Jeotgalibacillus proteolyticus]
MKNNKAALLLWASHGFYIIFLPVWFMFFGLTVMGQDENAQAGNIAGVITEYAIGAYPVILLIVIAISWSSYHKRNWKKMILTNVIPLLWIAPILLTFLFANLV